MRQSIKTLTCLVLLLGLLSGKALAQVWTHTDTLDKDDPKKRAIFNMWVPPGVTKVRGLLLAGSEVCGGVFAKSPAIRKVATDESLAVLSVNGGLAGMFNGDEHGQQLLEGLQHLASLANMPEIAYAPWLTFGHSTAGLFAYRLAWWKPERTFGVILYKSGQIHEPTWWTPGNNIDNVPFMAMIGQYEEHGPEPLYPSGNFQGCPVKDPRPASCYRQVQWLSVRDTIMKRRYLTPYEIQTGSKKRHLMSMVATPGEKPGDAFAQHGTCSEINNEFLAVFVKKAAQRKIPYDKVATYGPVQLNYIPEESGFLSDTTIFQLITQPGVRKNITSPFQWYDRDPNITFWHFDKEMVEAWVNYLHDATIWNGGKSWLCTTEIAQSILNEQLSVYPNPASGLLNITLTKTDGQTVQVGLYNALGVQLYQKQISGNEAPEPIDIALLPNGYYTLKATTAKGTAVKGFVKQ